MSKRKDPLLRAAMRFQKCFQRRRTYEPTLERVVDSVLYQANLLARQLNGLRKAQKRDWTSAVRQMSGRIADTLAQLRRTSSEALNQTQQPQPPPAPTLRDLYGELVQLEQEFQPINFSPGDKIISAVSDAIELEGIHLGPFSIDLHMDWLAHRSEASAFDVIALDPHPASCAEDVTHPHVRDSQLCAGDATASIAQALRDGRICDAFLTVHAVLHQYNAESPYVSLKDWNGVRCADCECSTPPDDLHYCEDCSLDFCDDCFSSCDICDNSCCRYCLERDRESGQLCCRGCRHSCQRCHRIVDADSFESDTGLCPACHDNFLAEQEPEAVEQQTPTLA